MTDLLDNTAPVACSDVEPCLVQFLEGFSEPNFSCSCATMPDPPPPATPLLMLCGTGKTGTCNDPLKLTSAGVPNFQFTGDPGDAGSGEQIRIVFSKLLNNSIEKVTPSGSTTPGATNVYTLQPGLVELDDASGAMVAANTLYDNGGTPGINGNTSSDLIQAPLGPAIVIKPADSLSPLTTYTIKLQTASIKDREGDAPADTSGNPLPATYTIKFTTEDIQVAPVGAYPPDYTAPMTGEAACPPGAADTDPTTGMPCAPAAIFPNESIVFSFFAAMDPTVATISNFMGPTGTTAANIEFYASQGGDPTMCPAGGAPNVKDTQHVNMTFVSAPGKPADWVAGTYSFDVTFKDRDHVSSIKETVLFAVGGKDADPTMDAHAVANAVLPEQCTGK